MKRMKSKLTLTLLTALLIVGGQFSATAQNFNVESVIMELQKPVDDSEKDLTKCVEWITAASAHPKTSNSPKMHYWKGMTYLKIANANTDLTKMTPNAIDIALESFTKAMETDSKKKYTDDAKVNLLNVAIGLYNKGYGAYQAGSYSEAYDVFAKVGPLLAYDTEGQLKRNNLTTDAVGQMMAFCAVGDKDDAKALTAFQGLIKNGSTDPTNFLNAAKLQLATGDTAGALKTVQDGKELNEGNRDLINTELDIYLKQGRSAELITKLDAAIADDPGNTIYYFARAISYEGTGDMDKAAADYDKILEIDPNYHDASYNKGVMYLNKVSDIVDQMQGIYKPSELAPLETKVMDNYKLAIVQFEKVFANHDEMATEDKVELATTMKKIYAQLERMDKYNEMKAYIESN